MLTATPPSIRRLRQVMRPPVGRVAERIVEQVGEDLAHRVEIGVDRVRRRARGRARAPPGAARPGRPARSTTRAPRRRHRPRCRSAASGPDSMRDRSSRSSTSRCIRRALLRIVAEEPAGGLGVGRVAQQGLGVARDRGERGLELVRDVGDEVPAHRLEPADLGEVVQSPARRRRRAAAARSPGTRGRPSRAGGPAPSGPAAPRPPPRAPP